MNISVCKSFYIVNCFHYVGHTFCKAQSSSLATWRFSKHFDIAGVDRRTILGAMLEEMNS